MHKLAGLMYDVGIQIDVTTGFSHTITITKEAISVTLRRTNFMKFSMPLSTDSFLFSERRVEASSFCQKSKPRPSFQILGLHICSPLGPHVETAICNCMLAVEWQKMNTHLQAKSATNLR